jgi:DNA-binding transcriptional ArsR family regulator
VIRLVECDRKWQDRRRISMKPITTVDDPRYVKAMSHPLRVRILALLDERRASPNQLAGRLGAPLGMVAYHVRTLERLGLVELVKETRVRGAIEHHYRSRKRPAAITGGWEQARPVAKQAAIGFDLEVISQYARASAAAGGFDRGDARLRRTLVTLDQEGFEALSAKCDELLEAATRIEQQAADRIAQDKHEAVEAGLGLLLFEAVRLSADGARSRA